MNGAGGTVGASGALGLKVIRKEPLTVADVLLDREHPWPSHKLSMEEIVRYGMPQRGLPATVNDWRRRNQRNLWRGIRMIAPARLFKVPHFHGQLFLTKLTADGEIIDYGLAGLRMVTTAGVRFICDDFNAGSTDITNMKYHGLGTGALTEAVGNTALVTEITTAYNPDNTRPTGTQASATVSTNATYTTTGTITVDASVAATEHGIFSQAATGGGTLLDATSFTTVNLASGDSLQATYVLTMNAGG